MSNTRYTDAGGPMSQERYMSSPEYTGVRGVSGTACASRVAILRSEAQLNLILFLQALSLRAGGMKKVAVDILAMFPNRPGPPTTRTFGASPQKMFTEREDLDQFLTELCINPGIQFKAPGEQKFYGNYKRVTDHNGQEINLEEASVPYFKDIVGGLFEFMARHIQKARNDFVMTEIGRTVFECLDAGLETRKMVLIEGNSRIGKTTAVEAWTELHLGQARFVSLSGVSSKTSAFREIAKALGIASSYARTATEMQARIEDVLRKSRVMLVIDEAHFLFSQGERIYSRPEMIDWVDTSLCNHGVPVALVATPQFAERLYAAEHQVGWNADQFKGRVKRWKELPETAGKSDLNAIAKKLLPGVSEICIKQVVGYALTSKRYLPAIVDAIDEARIIAKKRGGQAISFEDLKCAIDNYCIPSDLAKARVFQKPAGGRRSARLPSGARSVAPSGYATRVGRDAETKLCPVPAGEGDGDGINHFDTVRVKL